MRHNPDFVARQVGEELVLVPVTRSASELESIFTLNEVGARIWNLIPECQSAEEIARRLADEYDVEADEALADVHELVHQLREIRAVID